MATLYINKKIFDFHQSKRNSWPYTNQFTSRLKILDETLKKHFPNSKKYINIIHTEIGKVR